MKFEQHCKTCNATRPIRFAAGTFPDGSTVHVKAYTGCCGTGMGRVYMTDVPFFEDSRTRIKSLTRNMDLINRCKAEMKFDETKLGLQKNIEYANLYLQIVNSAFS